MLGGDQDDAGLLGAMGVPQQQWDQVRGGSVLDVWEENWPALNVFADMQTQWRVGMAGPTGLDYAALPVVMEFQGVTPQERAECFAGVQLMEREALTIFGRKTHG